MRSSLTTIAAVLLLSLPVRADEAAATKDAVPGTATEIASQAQPHDVIYLSEQGPVAIRFRVLLDGRPQEQAWKSFVAGLFDSLDADADGALSGDEMKSIPSADVLRRTGLAGPTGRAAPAGPDRAPRDGRVTRSELERYFRDAGFGPFGASMSGNRGGMVVAYGGMAVPGVDLFARLDRNQDGRLSKDEFAVDARMRKQDLDDDQTLSAAELMPYTNPYRRLSIAAVRTQPQAVPPTFLVFDGSSSSAQDVKRLLDRYDGKPQPGDKAKPNSGSANVASGEDEKDGALTAAELGTLPEKLGDADADGNGRLDFDELRQWLRSPAPDVEVVVRLGRREEGQPQLELKPGPGMRADRIELKTSPDGATVVAGNANLELQGENSASLDLQQQFDREFGIADTDNNGYIDQQESRRLATFSTLFSLFDADGDGKIFKEEVKAFVERWSGAARCRATLGVADQGRKLFSILDTSGDGRLTERELVAGAERIADWDADGDGVLSAEEVPGTWRLSVGLASLGVVGRSLVVNAPFGVGGPVSRGKSAGPAWFQRMDRNGDGTVARREFLGPLADFKRLDADADGILSAEEAGPKMQSGDQPSTKVGAASE